VGHDAADYNAYYDGSKVEIVLPAAAFIAARRAGIRSSTTRCSTRTRAARRSATRSRTVFDDEGRQFDDKGNLNPWWTDSDSAQFASRAHKLVEQFNTYEIAGKHIRGQATLGENIADLGGVVLGYEAFQEDRPVEERRKDQRADPRPALLPRLRAVVARPAAPRLRCSSRS